MCKMLSYLPQCNHPLWQHPTQGMCVWRHDQCLLIRLPESASYLKNKNANTTHHCLNMGVCHQFLAEHFSTLNFKKRTEDPHELWDISYPRKKCIHIGCNVSCNKTVTDNSVMSQKEEISNPPANVVTIEKRSNIPDEDTDRHIKPALDSVTSDVPVPKFVYIVPGKGPPPEPPVDCCMSGCANCVWIQYAEELKKYFSVEEGNELAKKAIDQIENPGLQMFLKLELGLL